MMNIFHLPSHFLVANFFGLWIQNLYHLLKRITLCNTQWKIIVCNPQCCICNKVTSFVLWWHHFLFLSKSLHNRWLTFIYPSKKCFLDNIIMRSQMRFKGSNIATPLVFTLQFLSTAIANCILIRIMSFFSKIIWISWYDTFNLMKILPHSWCVWSIALALQFQIFFHVWMWLVACFMSFNIPIFALLCVRINKNNSTVIDNRFLSLFRQLEILIQRDGWHDVVMFGLS